MDLPGPDDDPAAASRESVFAVSISLREEARIKAIKPDVKYPKKGMFNRVHTIKEAIDKFEEDNSGKVDVRGVQRGEAVKVRDRSGSGE